MGGVKYNGSRLIPAPFVNIQKTYDKTGDGSKVGSIFSISLEGKLLACKGSPKSDGTFHTAAGYPDNEDVTTDETLGAFLQKQEAVRELFALEGKLLEIEPWDESQTGASGYMRVNDLNFPAGNWVDFVDYTISLETDELFGFPGAEDAEQTEDYFTDGNGNKLYLKEVSEDWALEFNDQPQDATSAHSFRLTHNLNAVGKSAYDAGGAISEPWEQARDWVYPRMGIDNNFLYSTSGLGLAVDYGGYNHVRSENSDEQAGSYQISETWIISSGNVFEDFTVSTQTGSETSLSTVNIEGTVVGLDTRNFNFDITETKWESAETKFDLINSTTIYNRAKDYSGITGLNSAELSTSIGRNPVAGTINYSFQYNDRPSNCIAGSLSENIQINDVNAHDVFAAIPVIGRVGGPVLQNMSTVTETTRTVNIDVLMPFDSTCPTSVANVTTILGASPQSAVNTLIQFFEDHLEANNDTVFKNQDQENWEPWVGRYSRTVGWTYGSC